MHSTQNPEHVLFGKTEDMPEGHMWQWFLAMQHTILLIDTLQRKTLDTIGWKAKRVLKRYHLFRNKSHS